VSDNTEVSIALNAAVNDIQFETNEIPRVTTETRGPRWPWIVPLRTEPYSNESAMMALITLT